MNIKLPVYLGLSVVLVACGGGGGSDSSSGGSGSTSFYTGVTTQATVTAANAPDYVDLLLNQGTAQTGVGGVLVGVTTTESALTSIKLTQWAGQVVSENVQDAAQQSSYLPGVVDSSSEDCLDNGSIDITINVNQSSGVFSGDLSFNNCTEGSSVTDGDISFSGAIDINTGEFSEPLEMSFTNLSLVDSEAGLDIESEGDISCDFTDMIDLYVFSCTQSIEIRDNIANTGYKFDNFTLTMTDTISSVSLELSGRVYHPDYGYVDVSTITPLTLYFEENPSDGVFLLEGNNSAARITVIDNSSYMLEIDPEGDGTYEPGTIENW